MELFDGILNPKQLDGLRLLLTPFPQQQFNMTSDRRSERPASWCCLFRLPFQRPHQRGHASRGRYSSTGTSSPDRYAESAWGQYSAALRLAARAEDRRSFTEFEQRAAYFDGDPVIATKKGVNPLERGSQVHEMAEFQALLEFRLRRSSASTASSIHAKQASPKCADRNFSSAKPNARRVTCRHTTPI